jgi:carboxylesterase
MTEGYGQDVTTLPVNASAFTLADMSVHDAPVGMMQDWRAIGRGENSKIAIIFVHGFTGSPISMHPWAEFFHTRGFTVSVPLLPGHGTKASDLNHVKWQQWPAKVEEELDWAHSLGFTTFIFGLSMGGATALNVALTHSSSLAGLVLVNPMAHVKFVPPQVAWFISRFQKERESVGDDIKKPGVTEHGYDVLPAVGAYQLIKMLSYTRKRLHDVTAPIMLFHSKDDHTLPVSNTEIVMARVGAIQKQRIELLNSYHVATLDYDAEIIFENSLLFVEAMKNGR